MNHLLNLRINLTAVSTTLLVLFTCLAASAAEITSVTAQTPDGDEYPVGNILPHINNRPGTSFDRETLSKDIQRLYRTGFFQDIGVDVDEISEDEIALTFLVEPVPRVGEIWFEGNSKIKNSKLEGEITISVGELFNPQEAARSASAIRQLYDEKSYYGTIVETRTEELENNQVAVVWEIDEQPRTKIKQVRFVGNTIFSRKQMLKQIRTDPTFWSRIFPVGFYSPQEMDIDKIRLQNMYAREGYLDFEVTEVQRKYTSNKKWVSITFFFDEGLPYIVGSVEVEGNKLFGKDELKRKFELEKGMIYTPVFQSQDVDMIRQMYAPQGYIDLRVRPELDKDPENQIVDVTYQIEEGEASTIRDVRITGNAVTRDEVIRRELLLHPGDLADPRKVNKSESVIRNLNYFENVSLTPLSTGTTDEKDLHVHVEEKRTGQLMAGAGFSSENAVIGTFQVTQTNFDLANWPTFRGGGQRMRLQLQLGTEQNNALVSFTEPWFLDRRLRLNLSGYLTTRDEGEYDRRQTGVSTSLAWQWPGDLRQEVGLRVEQIELDDFDSDVSAQLAAEEDTYNVTALAYSLSRDTRDRFIHATRGSRWELSAELQPEVLGTYSDIYKLSLDATKYSNLLDPFILRLKGEIAVADALSGDDVAIFDRYFAGGTSTFRGFDRREVSPVDVNEDPLGGKSLLLGTVEMSYPFTDNIRGSIFCDMGNVWAGAYDWDPADINVSVGIGVELQLPVGPIRLDYGFPVVTQQDHLSTGGRLHFNLGYYF